MLAVTYSRTFAKNAQAVAQLADAASDRYHYRIRYARFPC